MRPPRDAMISSVLSGRSRPRGSGTPTVLRGPVLWWADARIASESASIVVGLRAKWPHAKCGAAALFCGVPPRLTPWAVKNSLGCPRAHCKRPKKFRV